MNSIGRPGRPCPICLKPNSLERRDEQIACTNCGAVWRIRQSRRPFRRPIAWAELLEPASDGRGRELVGQERPLRFWRRIALQRSGGTRAWPTTGEKVIVREIVKVRCKHCGNLFDVTLDKCANCGAPL